MGVPSSCTCVVQCNRVLQCNSVTLLQCVTVKVIGSKWDGVGQKSILLFFESSKRF